MSRSEYEIRLPRERAEQDQEWCELVVDGEARRIRFHDYHEIYAIPGLYERLFYELLECDSPRAVTRLLGAELAARGRAAADLRVLEVGAGNGMVGEELSRLGAGSIVAVDIIEAAALAAERDRPGTYDDYLVVDLTALPHEADAALRSGRFNCLVTVAALAFGDIPPAAFATAYNLVEPGGLIAFNIKEDFMSAGDGSGFAGLIDRALAGGALELRAHRRYRHRLSIAGHPLHYVAVVAQKRADLAVPA